MGEALGVAVLGAGHMGADHVRRLDRVVSGARVAAVADPDPDRARAAAAGLPDCTVHTDALAALDAPGVEAVLIASPAEAHEAALLGCFARGLPVLCEKPLAPDARGALRLAEAEAASGARLARVGFMRRYDREYQALKDLLDSGKLGRPLMLHCTHRNVSSPPHFTSEMLIGSSVSHEIDAARWLLGEEIDAVTVLRPRSTAHAPQGLTDPQFVVMETSGGVLVDVEIYVNSGFGYQVRCEAVCEGGGARIGEDHAMIVHSAAGAGQEIAQDYLTRFVQAYDTEVRDWVAAVRAGGPTGGPSVWDGYVASVVAEAGIASLHSGGRVPVRLAPRPGIYA
ncbi:Gfo/Idh/MocA family protein [Streptomyces sp. NPDC088923]|uniref:Gfo/Idh/MocA family protein n=1 Tax=Streptomyces sp. NPDC088923 TaxID=3365913 RepID=UPI003815FB15